MKLTTFRKLLRRKLQQDNESHKSALHALIKRITAYPDRKMEVKFRIGEKVEGTHGGRVCTPTSQHAPYGSWTREDHYAVFEACLLRWKIIRRNVRTAVAFMWLVGVRKGYQLRATYTYLITPYTSYLLRGF